MVVNGGWTIGCDWLKYIIYIANNTLYTEKLGAVAPYKAKLLVILKQPHSVPFAIWSAIGQELYCLEQQGISDKVTHSE